MVAFRKAVTALSMSSCDVVKFEVQSSGTAVAQAPPGRSLKTNHAQMYRISGRTVPSEG